jgi:competence protein ComEC
MENKSGIVSISFPFVAGVCAAALARQPFAGALVGSAATAALICMCAASRKRCTPQITLLFFFLGAFCWCSRALCPAPPLKPPTHAIDALTKLLESIPFRGEHSGAIIEALLTGRRGGLPRDTVAALRKSGASPILALSGLHLGVIYACIGRILKPMGNSPAVLLLRSAATIALCGFYTLATGASPSIVRAFLFIVINETGRALSGRAHSPLGTFCTALTLQLALRPETIASVGFQLSYLAMLGITLLYPRLERWYPGTGRADPVRYVWKCAALSISCQLFTAPVAWWHFRSLPLYFLITNLIALPLTELIIIGALASAVLQATLGCPQALADAVGSLVETLEFCLETIASI